MQGYYHVNCQDPAYWIDFLKNDFDYSPELTQKGQEITIVGTEISEATSLCKDIRKPTGMIFKRK